MNKIKQLLDYINNNYLLDSTKRDRRQVLSIFVLSILILTGNKIYSTIQKQINVANPDSTIVAINKKDTTIIAKQENDSLNRLDKFITERYNKLTLFKFDPNTVNENQLEQLGLTQKQINTLINYRTKGGYFTCKDDFRKLYGIRYLQFKILRPYIDLPEKDTNNISNNIAQRQKYNKNNKQSTTETQQPKNQLDDSTETKLFNFDPNFITEEQMYQLGFYTKQIESFIKKREDGYKFYIKEDFKTLFFVDDKKYKQLEPYIKIDLIRLLGHEAYNLNTVTAEQLAQNTEITPHEAAAIIKMRNALGGFYTVYQLRDCGINYDRTSKLVEYLYVAPSYKINKININEIDEEALKNHPLFNNKQAAAIINFRKEKGKIMHIEDVKTLNRFDKNELKKIERYFSFK